MARRPDLAADRLVYFSDAVVAIAITLLVLPLVDLVPEARREPVGEVLLGNAGPMTAFLLGFAVIARLWTTHHSLFDTVERVTPWMVRLDLIWLFTIVVLPFPTALTGYRSDDPVTARLYVGVLALNLATMTALAALVGRGSDDPERSAALTRGVGTSAGLVTVGFGLLFVVPALSFWVLLLMLFDAPVERAVMAVRRGRHGSPG